MDATTINWIIKTIGLALFSHAVRVLSKLEKSVEQLNVQMAVVVSEVNAHERRLTNIEGEIKCKS